MASTAFLLGGCSDGNDGINGLNGTDASTSVKVADLTPAEWSNFSFDKDSGIIGVPAINSPPVVNFKVTSNGKPVVGLPLAKMSFAIAKLVPGTNGAPSQWINYNVIDEVKKTGKYPSVEKDGTLVDNGDGTYQYTFKRDITKAKALADALVDSGDQRKADLGDLTYNPALTHRLVVGISSTSPKSADWAYAMKTPYERIIDFIPATGQVVTDASGRDVISGDSCIECHSGTKRFAAHHATRQDPRYCMVCHNEQIKYGSKEAAVVNGNYDGVSTNMINGFAVGNFTTFVHKIHMGTKLSKTGYNFEDAAVNVPAMNFEKVAYPQDIRNCTKCHKNSANADNWMNVPSRSACGSCHDSINFTNGSHNGQTSDIGCAGCHNPAAVKAVHTQNLPATADAAKRTMTATITDVTVDANGVVKAKFTVKDGGVAVTDTAKFSVAAATLVKLSKGADGAYRWVSYINQFRSKVATMTPVLQATADTGGIITANGDGTFTYTFGLDNDSTGLHSVNNITIAPVKRSTGTWPASYANVVAYEPTKTHRVALSIQKVNADATKVDNNTDSFLDFVPAGGAVTETKNVLAMQNCNTCHNGKKMHRGYSIEFCVTCHNEGTKDPISGESVDLQHIVHKIHSGIAGYKINGEDFGYVRYPGATNKCQVCHVEGTGAPANAANWRTTPTANACITCHSNSLATTHAAQNDNTCVVCHAPGRTADSQIMHQ